ncbi:MAG: alpha-glucan family phosphorylase [Candidatus Omnitrophota bacterium]|jgi:starch phosphorylase|nr:MAG: alpha-glucan family phosphorylase [Candidatus Omnitrophota bacterium]
MEIGFDSKVPTYSGGLGILAGDTIKSCADLKVPLVAVTLLYKKGYFDQALDAQGNQKESACLWEPSDFLRPLAAKIQVKIEGRTVVVQAWQYMVQGIGGYRIPIIFLDTDLAENSEYDRSLSYYLYGGDEKHRLAQEIILGIGGVRMLKELNYHRISRYHMNEGHASLLTLELLAQRTKEGSHWDVDGVKRMCAFTTHTPVPAGHDKFSYDLVHGLLNDYIPLDVLKKYGGEERLNMTLLALNLSHYVNGVAKKHGEVSQEMFPGYHIDSITNGVHSLTWVGDSFTKLFDARISGWQHDPFSLRYALSIPREAVWQAHVEAKRTLIEYVNAHTDAQMDLDVMTIGFARRATAYKRADLVFYDIDRLKTIAQQTGKLQFIFSGKAHPRDWPGKELIKKIYAMSASLKDHVKIAYLKNYDMELAKMLISGVDLWLNTPRKPKEASGSSGMKAAHNGVPSLSILDGWWIEGCIEDFTGWSIGSAEDAESNDEQDARFLYEKLEKVIIPSYYTNRTHWIDIMRHSIAINASFFNTHRMVQQYVLNAYSY